MKQKLEKYEILLLLMIAALIGSSMGALTKIGLQTLDPIQFTFLRFLFASMILVPILFYREKKISIVIKNNLFLISLLGTANVLLFIFGIRNTTAIISQTLYAAVPLVSAIIGFLMFRERLGVKKEIGLLVGFLGVIFIIFLPFLGKSTLASGGLAGNLLIFLAVIFVSFYFIFTKSLQEKYSPLYITTSLVVITFLSQLLLMFGAPQSFNRIIHVPFSGLVAAIISGAVGTGIYYLLYQFAIKKATPVIASLTFYMQPVFGVFWAWILIGEKLTLGFVIGAVLTLVGVYIVTNSE